MLVSIKDFSEERNVDNDTVNAYLRNHPEIKQHTKRVRKNIVIDTESEAYALLERQYPLPQWYRLWKIPRAERSLSKHKSLSYSCRKKSMNKASSSHRQKLQRCCWKTSRCSLKKWKLKKLICRNSLMLKEVRHGGRS